MFASMKPPFHTNCEPLCLCPSLSSWKQLQLRCNCIQWLQEWQGTLVNVQGPSLLSHSPFEENVNRLQAQWWQISWFCTVGPMWRVAVWLGGQQLSTLQSSSLSFSKHSTLIDTHNFLCIMNTDSGCSCRDFIAVGNNCFQQSTAGMPLINIHIHDKNIFTSCSSNKDPSPIGRFLSIYSLQF